MPESGQIGEERRWALMGRLCEVLGEEEARTLMESLPPVAWDRIATKDDIFLLKGDIRASEDRLRTEIHAEFTKIYAEFTKVYAEFANIRTETAAEFKMLRAENKEIRGEMALQFAKQTRTMVFTMLGLAMPILGTILAVGLN